MSSEAQHNSVETRVIWLTSGSHFLTHGFMTLFSAVMVVIAGENSMSFMEIGIIANVGYFLYGFGGIPAGYMADRFGPKQVLTLGVLGMSISSILVGSSYGMWPFAVAYALLGLFSSIHHPAGLTFIARGVGSRRGKAMGIHGVLGNLGLFLTPMVGAGFMWYFNSWRAPYLVYGLVGLIFCVILHRAEIPGEANLSLSTILARRRSPKEEDRSMLVPPSEKDGVASSSVPLALILLFAGSILSGFIFRGSLTFLPALLRQEVRFVINQDFPVVMAGYLTTAVLSFGLIGAWFGGYINDKIKKPEFFPALVFLLVAPIFYLISRYSDYKLIIMCSFFSLIYYAWQPCQNYLIAKYTKKSSHGMGFGINFFLLFGVGSIATSVGGYVTDKFGVDHFYGLMSIVSVIALVVSTAVYFVRKYSVSFSRKRPRSLWKLEREPLG